MTINLYVFGDSLSDTGNFFGATGGLIPPATLGYKEGRFSNGSVAVEQLASGLGSNYRLEQSNNFAFGGATTGQGNAFEDDLRTDLPGLLDQIEAFRRGVGTSADANGLYMVWAGPNDFLDTLGGSPLPSPTGDRVFGDPAVLVRQGAANIRQAITTLQELGASHLVVPNMPNLGLLPGTRAFSPEATAISRAFNAAVDLELSNLALGVTRVDIYTVGEAVAANPGQFGFTNVTDPLLPLQLGPNPPDPNGFFFWDTLHPTTRGHGSFANLMQQTLQGTVPQPVFNAITGTVGNDCRLGTSGNDDIRGLAGNDFLTGGSGNDRIQGDLGNDLLLGDLGDDSLSGGDGDDLLDGGAGDDIVFGGNGNDLILGQAGNDVLVGDAGNDLIIGGLGDDYLLGAEGDDRLWGNLGEDILNGGGGDDLLEGGAGNDRLNGGAGKDLIVTGPGNDIVVFQPGGGHDGVFDFQPGADRIDLKSFFKDIPNFGFGDFQSRVAFCGSTLDFGNGDTLSLYHITASTLTASDFIFA